MRSILHTPFCYWPDAIGGTEVYVRGLAAALYKQRVRCSIAAPGEHDQQYTHGDFDVYRYKTSPCISPEQMYGDGDPVAAAGFGRVLDIVKPDVVNFHAFTSGVSLLAAQEAKRRNIPVVLTYHTPTVSCPRGTLLELGTAVCDGRLDTSRCTKCTAHAHGVPTPLASLIAVVPQWAGSSLGKMGLQGGAWTALRMSCLIALREKTFRRMVDSADQIVAVCEWVRNLLITNGVPAEKITLSRQAIPATRIGAVAERATSADGVLRIAFLGRIDSTKGIDILIRAIHGLPGLPIELDVYGIAQGGAGEALQQRLQSLSASTGQIRFLTPISADEVMHTLQRYDVLAAPSQGLETGPLVAYEAFGAGVPVIGSNLGGIAEIVTHEQDGLLVEHNSVKAWQNALRRLVDEPGLLPQLRRGIRAPRTMELAASEMMAVYEKVLHMGAATVV